ncbi:hypothetical protein JTE90_012700 [Oedothorax gibbosus]|uniref:Uncharacterized protein n=1 Tax=Oedothorax gibbosus TaxID=931172 RepID=A0AAV6VY88_9ARAC|nr:hypothetical protein JTE90_012700 [Oedothorax gibbosus]
MKFPLALKFNNSDSTMDPDQNYLEKHVKQKAQFSGPHYNTMRASSRVSKQETPKSADYGILPGLQIRTSSRVSKPDLQTRRSSRVSKLQSQVSRL